MGLRHLETIRLLIWLLKCGHRSGAQNSSSSLDLGMEMQKASRTLWGPSQGRSGGSSWMELPPKMLSSPETSRVTQTKGFC